MATSAIGMVNTQCTYQTKYVQQSVARHHAVAATLHRMGIGGSMLRAINTQTQDVGNQIDTFGRGAHFIQGLEHIGAMLWLSCCV